LLHYADFDPQEIEEALFEMVVWAALGARPLRGKTINWCKRGFRGRLEVVASGDGVAQKRGLVILKKRLPGVGCAEGQGLRLRCTLRDSHAYVTFDPVNGSLAYSRDLPYGATVMVSLVVNGQVVAAYVADINNCDVFGFGPATTQVKYWRNFGIDGEGYVDLDEYEIVAPDYSRSLAEQSVLLYGERESYSPGIAAIARSTELGGIFSHYESVASGVSIGSAMLSLVRGHVGALALRASGKWSPGDDSPVIGFAEACNLAYLKPTFDNTELREFVPYPPKKIANRPQEILLVSRHHVETVQAAFAAAE
jgi:hypothetical protein